MQEEKRDADHENVPVGGLQNAKQRHRKEDNAVV
jgi:hypothetical protein